jgi:hypothetical protein
MPYRFYSDPIYCFVVFSYFLKLWRYFNRSLTGDVVTGERNWSLISTSQLYAALVTMSLLLVTVVNERSIGRWCHWSLVSVSEIQYWSLVSTSEVLVAGVNKLSIGRWCQ